MLGKTVRIGSLNTLITVKSVTIGVDADGYPTETCVDVFGEPICASWVNAHGNEVFENLRNDLREVATVVTRYSPLITPRCIIFHGDDTEPYEIISIDNISDAHRFMEIKVRRIVKA